MARRAWNSAASAAAGLPRRVSKEFKAPCQARGLPMVRGRSEIPDSRHEQDCLATFETNCLCSELILSFNLSIGPDGDPLFSTHAATWTGRLVPPYRFRRRGRRARKQGGCRRR